MSVTTQRGFSYLAQSNHRGGSPDDNGTGTDSSEKSSPTRRMLASLMVKAKRNGSWFRLTRLERGLFSLAININAKFESVSLVRAIVSVLRKLKEYSDPLLAFVLRGTEMARAFSHAAAKWGHTEASSWVHDRSYLAFLGRFLSSSGHRW